MCGWPVGGGWSLLGLQMGGGSGFVVIVKAEPRSAFSPHRVTFLLCSFTGAKIVGQKTADFLGEREKKNGAETTRGRDPSAEM